MQPKIEQMVKDAIQPHLQPLLDKQVILEETVSDNTVCIDWLDNVTFMISWYSNIMKTKAGPSRVLFLLFQSHVN
jgi:hypothetical protein